MEWTSRVRRRKKGLQSTSDIHRIRDRIPGILTFTPMKALQSNTPVPKIESTMNTTPLIENDDLGEVIERPI